jgi:hypothetical protein
VAGVSGSCSCNKMGCVAFVLGLLNNQITYGIQLERESTNTRHVEVDSVGEKYVT